MPALALVKTVSKLDHLLSCGTCCVAGTRSESGRSVPCAMLADLSPVGPTLGVALEDSGVRRTRSVQQLLHADRNGATAVSQPAQALIVKSPTCKYTICILDKVLPESQ